jgi:hypothetical protein
MACCASAPGQIEPHALPRRSYLISPIFGNERWGGGSPRQSPCRKGDAHPHCFKFGNAGFDMLPFILPSFCLGTGGRYFGITVLCPLSVRPFLSDRARTLPKAECPPPDLITGLRCAWLLPSTRHIFLLTLHRATLCRRWPWGQHWRFAVLCGLETFILFHSREWVDHTAIDDRPAQASAGKTTTSPWMWRLGFGRDIIGSRD